MGCALTSHPRYSRLSLWHEAPDLSWTPRAALPGDREADVERGMVTMVAALESGIRRWPDQWFPLEAIWPRERHP